MITRFAQMILLLGSGLFIMMAAALCGVIEMFKK